MKYLYIVLLFITIVNSVYTFIDYGLLGDYEYYLDSPEFDSPTPKKLMTEPKIFEVVVGDSVVLPCESGVPINFRAWRRLGLWSQSNIKLLKNGSLKVQIMSQNDTGDYICELWVNHQVHKITHKVTLKMGISDAVNEAKTPLLELSSPRTPALELPTLNVSHTDLIKEQDALKRNSLTTGKLFTQINSNYVSNEVEELPIKDAANISSNYQKLDENSNITFALHSLLSYKQKNRVYNQKKSGRAYSSASAKGETFGFSSYPKMTLYWIVTVSLLHMYYLR